MYLYSNALANNVLSIDGGNGYTYFAYNVYSASWWRSTGATGWYNETYGGGINMEDSTYVRVYAGKEFLVSNTLNIQSSAPTIRTLDVDDNLQSWIHHQAGQHGFLQNNAFAWAAYRDPSNNWACVGDIIAYASDQRLKIDRGLIDYAEVDRILHGTEIKLFDWDALALEAYSIGIEAKVNQIGAMAQQVQSLWSEAVVVNEGHNPIGGPKHDILTIKWDKYIPLLVANTHTVKRCMTDHERRIEELEDEVRMLKSQRLN